MGKAELEMQFMNTTPIEGIRENDPSFVNYFVFVAFVAIILFFI